MMHCCVDASGLKAYPCFFSMIKMYSPENALKLYARAIDIADVEDRNHDLYTLYENSVALTLKLKKY